MTQTAPPVPQPDAVTRPFWDGCARRELLYQQCGRCAHRWLPPSVACPRCWADDVDWARASGEATVFSFAVYRRAYHPAFAASLPYVVAAVELAEGPRLLSNVVGAPPEKLRVGTRVRLEFEERNGAVLPVFRPLAGGDAP